MTEKEANFTHRSKNGTLFLCKTKDFSTHVEVQRQGGITEEQFASDVAEMIASHHALVWPNLDSFAGYDTINFRVIG